MQETLARTNLKVLSMFTRVLKHCLHMPNQENNVSLAGQIAGKIRDI